MFDTYSASLVAQLLQLPLHPGQLPEQVAASGQPMHLTPFFFSLRI